MKKKIFIIGLLALVFCMVLAFSASAAGNTVAYIKDGGTGDGSSPEKAAGTLTKAHDYLDRSKDCTIVICGDYTLNVNWVYSKGEYDGCITFTSVYDGVDYRKTGAKFNFKNVRFYCFGDTKFENLDFVSLGTTEGDSSYIVIAAQHNNITVGEGVTMTGKKMTGGNVSSAFTIVGGYVDGKYALSKSSEDTNITLLSGSKFYVIPFSRGLEGTYDGTANIKIGGTANVSVLHGSALLPSKYESGVSVGNVKVEVCDKAKVETFYGATDPVTVNSYDITLKNGIINDFQWNCKYTPDANIKIVDKAVLNVPPSVKNMAGFSTLAANFNKVNEIAEEAPADTDKLTNATVVYLKDGGTGNGKSAEEAVSTLEDAYAALDLSKDCTIVVCGDFFQAENFSYGTDYTGSVTFTSVYNDVDYRKSGAAYQFKACRFGCFGDTRFTNIDFECTGTNMLVVAQHNPVTVGKGVTMTGKGMTGNSIAKAFCIMGGYQKNFNNPPLSSDKDTNITVLSGSKLYILPFSREILGDYTGTANIYVGGTADVSVLHGSSAYPDGIAVGDVKIMVEGDARIGSFYGCTQVTKAKSYDFTWAGGTISKFEWECGATPAASLSVSGSKILRYTADVTSNSNYDSIASLFDKVVAVGTVVDQTDKLKAPATSGDYGAARGLFLLGLAKGYDTTGTNFGLKDGITRLHTVINVIRFLGVEEEVLSKTYTISFTDVPSWATNYVGYAYENGITQGRTQTKFDPDSAVDEMQFLTFMLRAIGYSDKNGDFKWDNPFDLAYKVGMKNNTTPAKTFNRGNAFATSYTTLFANAKNGKQVFENLISSNVFARADLDKAMTEASTAKEKKTNNTVIENGYYVIPVKTYEDKTFAGLMAQFTGFLSGYEFAKNSDGTPRVALPDSWFELCNGPYAERNSKNVHEDKLLYNEETKVWEVWNDDDFSIDFLNQYILKDMYSQYGTFATKVITDDWVKYDVWDMGGGHRRQGAYGLMSSYGYLPSFAGNKEFGNLYNVNGEPYIANETLGLSAAAMPNLAVEQAEIFGSVTSDRDPVRWLKLFTAMISMAYVENDIPTMIREAEKVLPEGCWQREVIDMIFDLHKQYPDDWRRAAVNAEKMVVQKHYDLENYNGETSINCSFILIGLLYGDGDFYETCKIISLAGHGGDSTTPVGLTVAAVACGWEGVDEETKKIINEKVWQDGNGILVNLEAHEKNDYWMFCAGLPERIKIADIFDMYKQNFESNLLANGGKIANGNYYIPVTKLEAVDTVFVDEFESGKLDGYDKTGTVEVDNTPFSGNFGGKLFGNAVSSSLTKKISGLTVGKTYCASAFIKTATDVTANFAVKCGGKTYTTTVFNQVNFVKREIVFTATATTAEVVFSVPANTETHRYASIDEIWVIGVKEEAAGTATISGTKGENGYTKADVAVNAAVSDEVYLKVTFANNNRGIVNSKLSIDGESYAGVPFYTTGADKDQNNTAYIPIIAKNGANSYTVSFDFGGAEIELYSAEVITK